MRLPLAAAAALLTLTSAADTLARPPRAPSPLKLSPDVVDVVTVTRGDARVRAVAAEDRGAPFVQIDDLSRGRRGWVVTDSERFDVFFADDIALDTRGATVSNLTVRRKVVAFELDGRQHFLCRVRLPSDDERRPNQVRCGLAFDDDEAWEPRTPRHPGGPDRDVPPPVRPDDRGPGRVPPPPQWGAMPNVIKACGDAFIGSNSQRCLDIVRDYTYDPVPAIRACEDAVIGDEHGLQCLQHAKAFRGDPSSALRACNDALIGDDSVMACLDAAAFARVDPAPAIRACADAAIGDNNTLSCIQGAFRR
ncbi:MAG: hypothetical protein KC635_18840 [Myxococcales bacterium]|nr:hypothetical protein [Myxococcales bacterium]